MLLRQVQEREPFICELLTMLGDTIQDLQPHQIHTFYEAVGLMIGAEGEASRRDDYLVGGRVGGQEGQLPDGVGG